MAIQGVDFSYGRPGGAALAAAGKRFAVRYINGAQGKALSAAEIADYQAHGLAICLVFESSKGEPLSGPAAGRADAALARDNAAALGVPAAVPIYFAVDFNVTANEMPAIDAYLLAAAEVLGAARVGVYGHNRLMAHCAKVGSARWFWQTYAWSGGQVDSHAHLIQWSNGQTINRAAVDFDLALQAAYGQWDPTTGGGTTTEDTMAQIAITTETPLLVSAKAGVMMYELDGKTEIQPVSIALVDELSPWGRGHVLREVAVRTGGQVRTVLVAPTTTKAVPDCAAIAKARDDYHDRLVRIAQLSAV